MNRRERIKSQAPGASDALIDGLASLPLAEVDLVVAALKQARRDAVEEERSRRKQRKRGVRYDVDEIAARNGRIVRATGQRASGDLDALAALANMADHARAMIPVAVDGLRVRGYSDTEIGEALGVSRQAVGQTYGRRHDPHMDSFGRTPSHEDFG